MYSDVQCVDMISKIWYIGEKPFCERTLLNSKDPIHVQPHSYGLFWQSSRDTRPHYVRVHKVFLSGPVCSCPHCIRLRTVSVSALCPCPHGIRVRTVSVLALYPCSNGVSVRAVSVSALCLCPHCIRVRSVSVFVSTYSVCQHENTRAIY